MDFPYEEIRKPSGDYFDSATECMEQLDCSFNQVWSISEMDGIYTYGPAGHIVNVVGFIGTEEYHDGDTYFEEDTNERV